MIYQEEVEQSFSIKTQFINVKWKYIYCHCWCKEGLTVIKK